MNFQVLKICRQTVLVSKRSDLCRKIELVVANGPDMLNVVSDFDFTMTKFKVGNERGASCHAVLEGCGMLSPEYHTAACALQAKYYPLEVSPHIDLATKTGYMVDWVTSAHKLLLESRVSHSIIKEAVAKAVANKRIGMRNFVHDFMIKLDIHQVPLLIFSAGIADVLEEVIRVQTKQSIPDSVHVVSNRCIFVTEEAQPSECSEDDAAPPTIGEICGFEEPVFHVLNKRGSAIQHTPFFQREDLKCRSNLILVGDSLGDINMSEGLTYNKDTILRIGFLNDRPERLAEYLEVYDMVILGDPSFEIPLHIVECICAQTPSSHFM